MSHLNIAEAVPLGYAMVARVAQDAGVRALLIKGPASAALGLRSAGQASADVDVWIAPSEVSMFQGVLENLGWARRFIPTSSQITPLHAFSLSHPFWPCEIDLHDRYPGFLVDEQSSFESLWATRGMATIAHQRVWVPSLAGMAAIDALHCLRSRRHPRDLDRLARRFVDSASPEDKTELGALAEGTGAVKTLAPLLERAGIRVREVGLHDAELALAWEVGLAASTVKSVPTLMRLSRSPKREWLKIAWRASMLSEIEIRIIYPDAPCGLVGLGVARAKRLMGAASDLPRAIAIIWRARKGMLDQ